MNVGDDRFTIFNFDIKRSSTNGPLIMIFLDTDVNFHTTKSLKCDYFSDRIKLKGL